MGEDLSWFWRGWLYTTAQLDQAVDSVAVADSAGVESRIYLRNAGGIPMPVELALLMDDGSTQRLTLPVEIWFGGATYTAIVPGPRKVKLGHGGSRREVSRRPAREQPLARRSRPVGDAHGSTATCHRPLSMSLA